MWNEYAIDPQLFSSWEYYQILGSQIGVSKGRLICNVPDIQTWKNRAYAELLKRIEQQPIGEVKRSTIVLAIKNIGDSCIKNRLVPDTYEDFFSMVEAEHKKKPFFSIICNTNPSRIPIVMHTDDIHEDNLLWRSDQQEYMDRDSDKIAQICEKLFAISNRAILVDPHFNPNYKRYRTSLIRYMQTLFSANRKINVLEYHLQVSEKMPYSEFKEKCTEYFGNLLNTGKSIKFTRFKSFEKTVFASGQSKMHPRFILTDKGGLNIEHGLDDGPAGSKTLITRLEKNIHSIVWTGHQENSTPLIRIDEFILQR